MDITDTSRPLNKIEQQAIELLTQCQQDSLPIDVERVAAFLNAKIVQEELDPDVSGALVISNDVPVIAVNKEHGPNRQRFTIAHELGHLVLDGKSREVFVDRSAVFFRSNVSATGVDPSEVAANNFAAALLMPKTHLLAALKAIDEVLTSAHIKKLANDFAVSEQAMTIRLARLDLVGFI